MPSQDVVIDAQWSDLAQGEFSVTLRHSPNGRSYVNPTYGKNGESITLVLMPEFLYQYDSFTEPPQDLVKVDEKTFTFPMPSRNLTLEPKFRTIDPPNSLEPAESFFLTKPQGFHKL